MSNPGSNANEIADLGELPVWSGAQDAPNLATAPFKLISNQDGLIRLAENPAAHEKVEGYSSDHYVFPTSPPGSSDWGNALAEQSLTGLQTVAGGLDGLSVMEVGGGTLYCAEAMVERFGAESVTLVDPSIKEKSRIDRITLRREYFSTETVIDGQVDFIVSFNTLEHVPDPADFLLAANAHLKPGGKLFIKVPDCEVSLRNGDLGICTHEHLSYFTMKSLAELLGRAGFTVVSEANYLGALQVLAQKNDDQAAAPSRQSETPLGRFKERYHAHLSRLRTFANEHAGMRVGFIGASVGLANTLFLSGVSEKLEIQIFDGDDQKTGKFLPGCATPILKTDDPTLRKMDHIFVTPANFFDEIVRQLSEYHGNELPKIEAVFPAEY